ncbi:PMD domain-containing protein [Abeliophyllum distichum]|uniref:PMD domain-containing protein n=1 Tax=Abeliophyllum distichum TaxID=126358 RepID=A0ABD1S8W5_9LAMI
MPCPSTLCVPLKELHMHILSSRQRNLDAFQHPSLGPPPHHSQDMKIIPRMIISERINQREIKWGSALSSRGEAPYLSKFWEWSVWIHKLLVKRNLPDLASAVYSATKDYSRPNSVYRALCEVWCPDTNTFITINGEIGISLWDIREITGLSIRGDYYEEVVQSLSELSNLLPQSCLYLFKAYSLIVDKKKTDRIRHADWIEFWFQEDDCVPNPQKSKPFKKAMESKPRKEGQRTVKDRIRRPVVTDRPKETLCRDRSHWNSYLSVDEEEELEIAAYLSLWLCHFIFPSSDDYLRVGTFKTASRMAAKSTYSLVPPILASIYRGLTETSNCMAGHDIGSIKYAFPGHFLYTWAATYFLRGIYSNIDKSIGRPIIRRYAGTLNDLQPWEVDMFDCRELVRGRMDLKDFCWNPIHLPPQCGIRTDKDDRSTEISEFMTSIRPGFLSYRRGSSSYILEAYNPHRFGRQQGFRQKLPGSPKDMNLVINPINLYCAWLALTQVGSGRSFHILGRTNNIQNQVDSAYEDWWNSEVFPRLNKIQMKELLSSEDTDFGLEQPAPIPKHTENDNAKDINPSRAASQRTFQKRALDIPDDGGPERLKFTFSSTRNVPSSERVEKIPGTILVSEDSNSGDQASRGLEATLVPEDSSSEDQTTLSLVHRRKRSTRLKKSQAIESNREVCAETSKMDLSIPDISLDDENLDMSPQTRNAGNNENLDIIDALDGIDGLNGSKDLPCDYPSHISGGILASKLADINDEGEVNSGTSVVKIPENEQGAPVTPSSLSLIVVPTSNINNRGIAPICSSMSRLPFGVTEDSSLLKDVFQEAMTKYLKKSFTDVIKHGFSNLRTWWAKSNQRLQNLITESFQADPAPLTRRMEVFLKRVDAYLSKRKQILECPTLEERDQQLESLNSRIDVEMAIFSSLESKIGQLASKLDKFRDELQTRKENLDKMEDARITLEQAQVRNIANVKSIDQERKTLEYNFLQLVESD